MKPAPFRYRRATTIAQAVVELAAHGGRAQILAGGQTLVAELSARRTAPEVVVDINGLRELDHVEITDDVVRIGALRRIAALEHDERLRTVLPALVDAASRIAHPAVRNRGTIGGNVAHADPASGIPPVLLAYGGEVILTGPAGVRTVAAEAFFTGYRSTETAPDEMITEIRFTRPAPGSGSGFAEISRRARGWGLAGACAVVTLRPDGQIGDLRLALLGLAPTAVRAEDAERRARGQAPDRATIDAVAEAAVADLAEIPADVHASPLLRRSLGRVAVRRALIDAIRRAGGA